MYAETFVKVQCNFVVTHDSINICLINKNTFGETNQDEVTLLLENFGKVNALEN